MHEIYSPFCIECLQCILQFLVQLLKLSLVVAEFILMTVQSLTGNREFSCAGEDSSAEQNTGLKILEKLKVLGTFSLFQFIAAAL